MSDRENYEDLQIQWLEESRADTPAASERECAAVAADEMWPAADGRRR